MPPADTPGVLPTDTHVVVEAVVFPPGACLPGRPCGRENCGCSVHGHHHATDLPVPGVVVTDGGRYCGRETCEMNGVGAHRHLDYDETVRGSVEDDPTPRVPYAGPIDLEI